MPSPGRPTSGRHSPAGPAADGGNRPPLVDSVRGAGRAAGGRTHRGERCRCRAAVPLTWGTRRRAGGHAADNLRTVAVGPFRWLAGEGGTRLLVRFRTA